MSEKTVGALTGLTRHEVSALAPSTRQASLVASGPAAVRAASTTFR